MRGSVYQRKDGRWVGVATVGKTCDGKRKQKYVYGKSEKETVRKLNNLVYEIQNNIFRDPGNITVKVFFNEWYNQNFNSWQETTQSLYKMYLDKHINPYLGEIKVRDLLPMHITDFVNKKLTENSPNTVNKYISLMSMALKSAVENKLILTNPVDSVKRPKKIKYRPKIYDTKQFEKLLNLVKGTFDEIPILLAGVCGLRRGEIFGLRWCDIDFNKRTLSIVETRVRFDKDSIKGAKNTSSFRTITAPGFVLEVLQSYRDSENIINLKTSEQRVCSKMKPQSYSEHFKLLLEKFEMEHIRLHDLRHFNAVIMMQYGIPDKVAASRLGHSNTQTLREVYQHVLTDMDIDASNRIEGIFAGKNVSQKAT